MTSGARRRALLAGLSLLLLSRCPSARAFVSEEPPVPDPRVLERLIQVEKVYEDGLKDVKEGRPQEGRRKIAAAYGLLLPFLDDDQLDNELHEDFESLLNGLRTEELGEVPSEPSPLEVRSDELLDVKTSTSTQVKDGTHGYTIAIDTANETTQKFLALYTAERRRPYAEEALERSGRYRPMIEAALQEAGLPRELFWLVMTESEYKPKAISRAGAAGLWQLMPGTARKLGLEVDYWVDERLDPEKATGAALKYLKDLRDWFGDWHLALASYNRGEGGLGKDLAFSKATRFETLADGHALPRETNEYVAKFAACVLLGEDPKAYGFDPRYEAPAEFEKVKLDKALDIEIAAKSAGTTGDVLRDLNPSLRAWCTPDRKGFELKLPKGSRETFLTNLAEVKDWNPAREWVRYRVARGDILGRIASRFHTTPKNIMADNHISNVRKLKPGLVLKIRPGRRFGPKSAAPSAGKKKKKKKR